MNQKLSDPIEKLKNKNIEFRLIKLQARAITVDDVVNFSKGDIKREEICKTIIVKSDAGDYYGLFLEGNKKIDFDKVRKLLNSKIRIATENEIKEITELEIGAVCPLLLKIPIIIDKSVMNMQRTNFGSGDHMYGIEMSPKDVVRLTNARLGNIIRD